MQREELQHIREQVECVTDMLYQNRAEGLQEMITLLSNIQQVGSACAEIDINRQLQVIQMLRALIEGYQMQDVLVLADILYYEVLEMIDFCLAKGEAH